MSINHQSDYVEDLLGRFESLAADARELALSTLTPLQQKQWLTAMFSFDAQLDGLKFSAIQEAEASGMSVSFGNRILTTHLAKETHQPAQTLGADRSLALWLNDFPVLHQALSAGVLSRSHVAELKTVDCHDVHHLMIRDQELFIDTAKHLVWTDFKGVVAYWLNAAKPDGELSDPSDPKYGMRVRTKADGDIVVTIHMDPITGEAFLTMHDAEVKKLETNERQALNDNPNAATTSHTQKNLDALLRLMVRGWRREDGTYPDFLVNLVMSEQVAEDLLARTYGHVDPSGDNPLDIDPFELPIDWSEIDGRCETIRGTPVHPKHALGVLLAGKLRRIVMDADSKVIDHGTDRRFFTKTQANALLVQQRGQCNLGTQTPFRWLQADHIKPSSKGGPTDLANGQMINGGENQAKRDS